MSAPSSRRNVCAVFVRPASPNSSTACAWTDKALHWGRPVVSGPVSRVIFRCRDRGQAWRNRRIGRSTRARLSVPDEPRDRAELGDGELLGARRRHDPGALEERLDGDAERLEAGPQHLTALAERGGGDALEGGLVGKGEQFGAWNDADEARNHLGRRHEGARRDI